MQRPVVLVEDNEAISEVLAEYLRIEGFEVHVAPTAAGGLQLLAAMRQPAFVILDLVLPDASGEAFLDVLSSWGQDHRVIVISATVHERLHDAATYPLVALALPKPFELDELVSALRSLA